MRTNLRYSRAPHENISSVWNAAVRPQGKEFKKFVYPDIFRIF